jgi:hypothetical protein
MGLDINKLKEKLEELQNPKKAKENKNQDTWGPTLGETKAVRMVEYPHSESGDPFVTLWMHYNIGQERGFVCPKKTYNNPCPACDFAWSLYKTDFNLFKNIAARQQFFAVVVSRDDERPTPRFWRFSKKVYEKILTDLINPDYQTAFDPYDGLDINVTMVKKDKDLYGTTTTTFARKESRLAKTDKEIKEVLASIKKIEDIYHVPTKDEIAAKLSNWLDGSKKDSETVKGGVAKESIAESSQEDVDKIFDEAYES